MGRVPTSSMGDPGDAGRNQGAVMNLLVPLVGSMARFGSCAQGAVPLAARQPSGPRQRAGRMAR